MNRLLAAAIVAAFIFAEIPTARAAGVSASSAVLMEASTGRVLYEKNPHEPRLIASITKLMTALVALESGHSPDEVVTVSDSCTRAEGSSIYLRAGEEITLEGLLYGMLLQSGNDAALAIAAHCGGSIEDFLRLMNAKAAALGMKETHFSNPNGLNADDHYSSAYDMALLARACLNNERLADIVATKSAVVGSRILTNHNKLLWRYPGCIGMKTGYTEKAGRTLISAACRDGLTLIAVTLNDPNDWADHTALLDGGFSSYVSVTLAESGQTVARLPVSGGLVPFVPVITTEKIAVPMGAQDRMDQEIVWTAPYPTVPVAVGAAAGTLICRLNGEQVSAVPLVYGISIPSALAPRPTPLQWLRERLGTYRSEQNTA